MNANAIYSELLNQNDRLIDLKNRMQRTVERICGSPPSPPAVPPSTPNGIKPLNSTYLSELDGITLANADLISTLNNELIWLESVFNTNDMPSAPAYSSGRG